MGLDGQRHTPAALLPGMTGTHCTGGWFGFWAGLCGCGKSHPTGSSSA